MNSIIIIILALLTASQSPAADYPIPNDGVYFDYYEHDLEADYVRERKNGEVDSSVKLMVTGDHSSSKKVDHSLAKHLYPTRSYAPVTLNCTQAGKDRTNQSMLMMYFGPDSVSLRTAGFGDVVFRRIDNTLHDPDRLAWQVAYEAEVREAKGGTMLVGQPTTVSAKYYAYLEPKALNLSNDQLQKDGIKFVVYDIQSRAFQNYFCK